MDELTKAIKSISDSDIRVDLAVAATHIKHITEGIDQLTNNVNKINERVSTNEKRLDTIETREKNKTESHSTFWGVVQKNWWRVLSIVIMGVGFLIAEFEIVRQAAIK